MVNDEEYGIKPLEQIVKLREMLIENMYSKHHKDLIEVYDHILENEQCVLYEDPKTNCVYCNGYAFDCKNYSKEK